MPSSISIGTISGLLELTDRFSPALKVAETNLANVGKRMESLGGKMTDIGQGLLPISIAVGAVAGATVKLAMDFESSFAGVRKTVDATEPEFEAMKQQFRALSKEIPVNVNELNRLGEAAGALGIPKAEIVDFARVMSQLGTTTNVTSDQAAESIAKIQNIFGAAGKQTENFASTLVALGNAGASTEHEILAMATRIASAGNTIGITQGEMLGFASALADVGLEAEAGGSAMSRTMTDIATAVSHGGKELEMFANVAGKSAAQFAETFKTAPAQAVTQFVEGLGRVKASGGDLIKTIEDLGVTEIRHSNMLRSVAGNAAGFAKSLQVQSVAWKEHKALVEEATKRYATFESKLTLAWNKLKDVGITIGTAVLPILTKALDSLMGLLPMIEKLAQAFGSLPEPIQAIGVGVVAMVAVAGPALIGLGLLIKGLGVSFSGLSTGFGGLAKGFDWFKSTMPMIVARTWMWKASLDGAGAATTFIMEAWPALAGTLGTIAKGFALLVNPVTLTIAAFAALGYAILKMTGTWDDFVQIIKDVGTVVAFVVGGALKDLWDWVKGIGAAIAGPFVTGWKMSIDAVRDMWQGFVSWIKDHTPQWVLDLVKGVQSFGTAVKDTVVGAKNSLHELAEAARNTGAEIEKALKKAPALVTGAGPKAPVADPLALLASMNQATRDAQSKSGFGLTAELAGFRQEIQKLSPIVRRELTEALKSPAFTMEELQKKTGLSTGALKIFEEQIKDTGKTSSDAKKKHDEWLASVKSFGNYGTVVMDANGKITRSLAGGVIPALQTYKSELNGVLMFGEDWSRELTSNQIQVTEFGQSLAVLPPSLGNIGKGMIDVTDETSDWGQALSDLSQTFQDLGQIAGGSLGKIFSTVGQIVTMTREWKGQQELIGKNGQKLGGNFGYLSTVFNGNAKAADRMSAGIASAATVAQGAQDVWAATSASRTRGGNALGGMMAGAKAGAAFGPYGMAIGAAAGLIVGLIRGKPAWAKAADEVARDFGTKISDELGKTIAKQAKEMFKGDRFAASIMNLKSIISEAGGITEKNFDQMAGKLRDTFVMLEMKVFSTAQATKVLDENWASFVAAGTDGAGRINLKLKEMIELNERFQTESKEIAAFLKGQGASALGGLGDIVGALVGDYQKVGDAVKDAQEKLDELKTSGKASAKELALAQKELTEALARQFSEAEKAKVSLTDLGTIAMSTFGAAVASGTGFYEALKLAQPGLADIQKAYENLGIPIQDAGLKALIMHNQMMTNNPALIAGINALATSMVNLDNMGLLNVETFAAMQHTGKSMFDKLLVEAQKVGGGAREALLPMQDWLHEAAEQAKLLGVPLDEATQDLINQSKEFGIWKDKGKSAFDTLIEKLDKFINKLLGIPDVEVDITTNHQSNNAPEEGGDQAQGGTYFVDKPTTFTAGEAGMEKVTFGGRRTANNPVGSAMPAIEVHLHGSFFGTQDELEELTQVGVVRALRRAGYTLEK